MRLSVTDGPIVVVPTHLNTWDGSPKEDPVALRRRRPSQVSLRSDDFDHGSEQTVPSHLSRMTRVRGVDVGDDPDTVTTTKQDPRFQISPRVLELSTEMFLRSTDRQTVSNLSSNPSYTSPLHGLPKRVRVRTYPGRPPTLKGPHESE